MSDICLLPGVFLCAFYEWYSLVVCVCVCVCAHACMHVFVCCASC